MKELSIIDRHPPLPGFLFLVGAVQFLMMLTLSTAMYPNYNLNLNYVSDLGATCRLVCTVYQPSSIIFNSSTFLFGLLALVGFVLLLQEKKTSYAYLGVLSSAGAIGVGLLTEEIMTIHGVLATLTFGTGALAAIMAYRYVSYPFNLFSVLMGLIGLVLLGLLGLLLYLNLGNPVYNSPQTLLGLGFGGIERLVLQSIVLWDMGFGAYIIRGSPPTR